eukprot:GHVU01170113.1.p2 GENE.GHVU01170113.1~~GHVU01170113.1.p2  ORF type:complete len:157 (+),score=18.51 GHVU01170113.1:793-1263(+)
MFLAYEPAGYKIEGSCTRDKPRHTPIASGTRKPVSNPSPSPAAPVAKADLRGAPVVSGEKGGVVAHKESQQRRARQHEAVAEGPKISLKRRKKRKSREKRERIEWRMKRKGRGQFLPSEGTDGIVGASKKGEPENPYYNSTKYYAPRRKAAIFLAF